MKKFLSVLIVLSLVFSLCVINASAEEFVTVKLNGVAMDFDVSAQVINGRTLVPLRGIFEAIGAKVEWDDPSQTVTAYRGDKTISLQIGSNSLFVNKDEKILDVPAQLINGRTLVPARAVAESLGAKVEWDEASQTVIITDEATPDFAELLKKKNEFTPESVEAKLNLSASVIEDAQMHSAT
ncbi:MAG: copper amine oxidase N-terminal domain-containing protein, partial [Eubacteriales bacterium]|nr:copper amine oxidase N-terminal domain-containing protein [Eubacteriales bacterium]